MTALRVIATDLDRTLLGKDGTLTDRTRAALTAARQADIAVVAVTARPPRAFEAWTALAAHLDAAICAGGMILYHPADRTTTTMHTLDPDAAALAAKTLRTAIPQLHFAIETGYDVIAEPGYTKVDSVLDRRRTAASLAEVFACAPPFVKLLAHLEGGNADELMGTASAMGIPGVSVWHSGSRDQLELGPPGVDKGTALAAWCTERRIGPEQVVAFGDSPADVPMLAWAGRSFAVADAHPAAAAAATDQCGTATADGVAAAIEALLR